MKHDVTANPAGAFQLDDPIVCFPLDRVAEVEGIEAGDRLDVAHVEQKSAQDGLVRNCPLSRAQLPGSTSYDLSSSPKSKPETDAWERSYHCAFVLDKPTFENFIRTAGVVIFLMRHRTAVV